jgi:hypothetical protein
MKVWLCAVQVREVFARRKDKLKERRSYPQQDAVQVGWRDAVQLRPSRVASLGLLQLMGAKHRATAGTFVQQRQAVVTSMLVAYMQCGTADASAELLHLCALGRRLPLQEFFLPGSLFAVKSLHTVRGERRTINFYSAARLDGLVCREEIVGKKLIERFSGRDDRLEYRSATFGTSLSSSGAASAVGGGVGLAADGFAADGRPQQQQQQLGLLGEAAAAAGTAGAGGATAGQDRALPILKMTEKFGRNPDKPADEDVAKRVFYLDQGKTMLCFQHGEGRLTAGYLVFHKDGQAQAVQVGLAGNAQQCTWSAVA